MKKLLNRFVMAVAVIAIVWQGILLFNFLKTEPRLEIAFEGAVPEQAQLALADYGAQVDGEKLVVYGDGVFLASEVSDIIKMSGVEQFVVSDSTQSRKLAVQSAEIYLFALELLGLILLSIWIIMDIKKTVRHCRRELKHLYFDELAHRSAEAMLLSVIKWILAIIVLILLLARLIAFELYISPQLLPPQYILDFKYYFTAHVSAQGSSEFEQFCRVNLKTLYALSTVNIALAALVTVKIWRKMTKQEEKSWQE